MGKVKTSFLLSSRHKKGCGDGKSSSLHSTSLDRHSEEFYSQTWQDARRKLRAVVDENLAECPVKSSCMEDQGGMSTKVTSDRSSKQTLKQRCWNALEWLVQWDLLLALVASTLLLVTAVLSHRKLRGVQNENESTSPGSSSSSTTSTNAPTYVYITQIIGSTWAIVAALTSLLVVWARRRASQKNRNVGVRRALRFFSAFLQRCEDIGEVRSVVSSGGEGGVGDINKVSKRNFIKQQLSSKSLMHPHSVSLENEGTTLTDIYPVYRSGKWVQIPSLLLVEGDVIALQVGDFAPASVEELYVPTIRSSIDGNNIPSRLPIQVESGERITLDTCRIFNAGWGENDVISSLPRGKITLSNDSKRLLELCNDTRLFIVKDTPLRQFLQFSYVKHRAPQSHRQAKTIRTFFFSMAISMFVATAVLILIRPSSTTSDLSLLIPLPLFTIISVIPMIMPTELTFLEAIGLARILVTAHPFASCRTRKAGFVGPNGLIQEVVTSNRPHVLLFVRYCLSTLRSRFFPEEAFITSQGSGGPSFIARRLEAFLQYIALSSVDLIPVPPVNMCFLEKMGVATAFCIVDDDLVCEPQSTPQQLLIPSSHGLKLLDLCPNFENESEMETMDGVGGGDTSGIHNRSRKHTNSVNSSLQSDSDSDDEHMQRESGNGANTSTQSIKVSTLNVLRRKWRTKKNKQSMKKERLSNRPLDERNNSVEDDEEEEDKMDNEVQFEDPSWWQYLPSLKCIGLACLLTRIEGSKKVSETDNNSVAQATNSTKTLRQPREECEQALIKHVTQYQNRSQLKALAQCIGFETKPNLYGPRGDVSPFVEMRRLHVISSSLLARRLELDRHALGVEDAKRWGHLRNDSLCVLVQDQRSKGLQLLTVGNPVVVAQLCTDSWHGQNSTISPLTENDRRSILDTCNNWSLSDLDVVAFSYAPVPHNLEQRILPTASEQGSTSIVNSYLIDNRSSNDMDGVITRDPSSDWSMVDRQIFLGMLGSLVSPREEIDYVLGSLTQAGVRFVYFSPRNMRRTKELASQMGIDVAWNCAISLRALDEGEEDPHRMVSTYADWDVNAKLPHGIDDVRRHLEQVDNVPLLVSLFTDVTEHSTKDMINIFREYHDTVIAVGLSHLSTNEGPFSAADIAIGVDVLLPPSVSSRNDAVNATSTSEKCNSERDHKWCAVGIDEPSLHVHEVEFVSSMAAHNCAFTLKGAWSLEFLPDVIASGRAALDATTSSALFTLFGNLTLGFLALLSPCSAATSIPYIPTLGVMIYHSIILPILSLSMSMTKAKGDAMESVPPKNDDSIVFGRGDGRRLYINLVVRSFFPAVGAQFLYLIALGELVVTYDAPYMQENCSMPPHSEGAYLSWGWGSNWVHVIRCPALRGYSGNARIWAGTLMFSQMMMCVVLCSMTFLYRYRSLYEEPPWLRNRFWSYCCPVCIVFVVLYTTLSMEGGKEAGGVARSLPWYFYILYILFPFIWIAIGEVIKFYHQRHEKRASMLRRLQFETRLGMWSPK